MKTTSDIFLIVLIVLFSTLDNTPLRATPPSRPNIILFIADDVSWNDIGCYQKANGDKHIVARTPNIDRLAGNGRRFDQAILTASSCSPSRSSIVTGRYPHNCGRASELHQPIASHIPWFPRLLKDAGYYTALVGKNHMSSEKTKDGSPGQPPAFDLISGRKVRGNQGGHVDWVKTVRERPVDKPFFFWFASYDAHRSWDGDNDWDKERYGPRHSRQDGTVPAFLVDDEATREDLASYRNEVTRFDSFIGEVVNELQRQNVLSNTLLIIMADNGRPFPRAKTRLHDSGMRTPFIVYWPKVLKKPGESTVSLISAIDIAPTLLSAANVRIPPTMQGVNFLSILEEPSAVVRQVAFSEHNWHDYEAHGRSVRTDDGWLYIKNNRPQLPWQGPADSVRSPSHVSLQTLRDQPDDLSVAQKDVFRAPRPQEELFFTPNDPLQLKNLASVAEDAKTLKQMQMFLQTWTEETCDSIPMTISRDQFDRETGKPLLPKSKSKDWFRGTPAGWDRKADRTLEHGPT
jgi:arylsulfatase A-like enzyme